MNLRTRITIVASVAAVVSTTVLPALSGAAPIDDKRRQAAELARQIEANDSQIVGLSEQLNGLTLKQEQARAAIADAEARTDAAIAERGRIRKTLAERAAQLYRGAGSATPLDQIDVSSVGEIGAREKYSAAAADRDDVLIARLQRTEEDLAARKADLERQKASYEAQQAAAESARSRLQSANRQNKALQSQVNGEIARLMEQERQAREAAVTRAAQAAAATRTPARSGGSRGTPIPQNFPDAPAPNGGAAAAVAFAKAQVGKGYRYATSGPDTFDCSGLTAAAWAQGGVSLAHYSGAQYQQTIRIGAGDLQPGDLVFYGAGGSQHVEIYIGGGMVVSASNPSSGVKMAGVRYGSASGYGRVRA
jgi:cell wall-associated NlpC family hydrolase